MKKKISVSRQTMQVSRVVTGVAALYYGLVSIGPSTFTRINIFVICVIAILMTFWTAFKSGVCNSLNHLCTEDDSDDE